MKTDLERFVELYASFGIVCDVDDLDSGYCITLLGNPIADSEEGTRSEKLMGYNGFYSHVIFNSNGSFNNQGFYE